MTREEIIYSIDQHYCKYCSWGSEPCSAMEHYVENGIVKCDVLFLFPVLIRGDKLKIWRELHG